MRRWALVPMSAAALLLAAPPAAARISSNTIGPTAALGSHGRVAVAEVLIDCTEGQAVRFTLTLDQAGATGAGREAGRCTGELRAYRVTVAARGEGAFVEGPARACATAVNPEPGGSEDSAKWCRATGVSLVAG